MIVTLEHHTPLIITANAIRTAWQSFDKSDNGGPKDRELIHRVGNKFKHSSTLEHLVYHFDIEGVSRALLQEFARHRMASPTVKSTRYTLRELKGELPFSVIDLSAGKDFWSDYHLQLKNRASKYLIYTGNTIVDKASISALENLRQVLSQGISNDIAKYCLPEAYKTDLKWTINARSLQNFLALRSNKSALWEIRELASAIFDAIPDDHKFLFEEYMYKEKVTE